MKKKEWKINVQPIRDKQVLKNILDELSKGRNGKRNVLIFKLGISTGLRISDIIKIKVSDVKGKTEFSIIEQKTNKKRIVYLDSVLIELTDYISEIGLETDWLFPNYWNVEKHISSNQYYKILQKVATTLDIDYLGTHSMRKSFGYFYYKEYKDVATLMQIFNHSSPKVTLSYIGITEEEIKNSLKGFKIF